MGGWQLEVMKMGIYMSFPVAIFHYFNQPEYFEEWVTKMKREIYPPDSKIKHQEMQEAIRKVQEKQELKILKAMEDNMKATT